MKQKRICNRCKKPILRTHRWKTVHHAFTIFGWTVVRWDTQRHRLCEYPTEVPATMPPKKRLNGEVPLPFPDAEAKLVFDENYEPLTLEEVDPHGI